MTMHLSSQEFVSALEEREDALAPARRAHLDGCASCQSQLAELRSVVEEAVEGADVPEPSPLFWDHFQARVLTAVQSEEQPVSRVRWWTSWIDARTVVAVSAMVVAIAASAALYLNRSAAPSGTLVDAGTPVASEAEPAVVAEASASLDGDEWEFVASVMGTLEDDDVHEVLAPSRNAVDTAIETLSSEELDRLMKLLKAEMGQGLE